MPESHTESVWTWVAALFGGSLVGVIGWVSRDRLKDLVAKVDEVKREVAELRDHLNVRIDALRSDLADIKARVAVIEDRLNRKHTGE